MKKLQKLTAIAIAAMTLMTPSLFADSRHRETTASRNDPPRHMRGFTVEGRIRDIDRDRNGFVIRLDRSGDVLFAPVQTRVDSRSDRRGRDRVRDLERGDVIRAVVTGDRGHVLQVSSITVLRDEDRRDDRNDRWISGIVNDVDRNAITLREDGTGRMIRVDTSEATQRAVRRGDRVRIRGDWERGGRFEAESIEFSGGRMRF